MDKPKPCLFSGKVHPIQNVFFNTNPSGFLVKFKIVPKETKNEETVEETGKDTEEEKGEKKEEEVE